MNESKLLVVAPRFPSINQPWIDTYLEQLISSGINFSVYTENGDSKVYGEKVDRLQLREKIIPVQLGTGPILMQIVRQFVSSPFATLLLLSRAVNVCVWCRCKGVPMRSSMVRLLRFLANLQHFCGYAAIHSHSEYSGFSFALLARLLNIPFVLTFHGLPPRGVSELSESRRRVLYATSQRVFVNTLFAKRQVESIGASESSIVVIPQGLNLQEFQMEAQRTPGQPLRVLTVGRYHRDKGQAYALLAAKRLVVADVDFHWTFVGVGPDLSRLRCLSELLRLDGKVEFLQALTSEELRKLYRESHIFVLPSITNPWGHVETQGVVLQEAQATGCVPVATYTGGIPECIHDCVDGILVRERSSREIASAISRLYADNHSYLQYRDAGRRNVEENFSSEMIGDRVATVLRAVMCPPAAP